MVPYFPCHHCTFMYILLNNHSEFLCCFLFLYTFRFYSSPYLYTETSLSSHKLTFVDSRYFSFALSAFLNIDLIVYILSSYTKSISITTTSKLLTQHFLSSELVLSVPSVENLLKPSVWNKHQFIWPRSVWK